MLQLFRSFMNSKSGVFVTLAVLALIAIAFAIGDIANTGTFGGVAGGDRVAIVGKRKISTSELEQAARTEFENQRRSNPTLTMEAFIAQGGLERVLDRLIDRTVLSEFAKTHGLRAGERLVGSEIARIPAFTGPDGKFSQDAYRAAIAQQGLTDQQVREDIASGLLVQQAIAPVLPGGVMPPSLVSHYAALLREKRHGSIGLLLSDAYAPTTGPSAAQLDEFYKKNKAAYMRPERRVIRYALFDASAVKNVTEPTEAEIAARYKRDAAQYAATEKRRLTQLVVPTDAAAKAIRDEMAKGKSLDVAAREKGLQVTQIGPITQSELSAQSSAAVAQAAFAAQRGQMAATARGGLGFYILRVDAVESTAGRTLDQARAEIRTALMAEKHRQAIADLSARVEDEFDGGSSLAEVAKDLGVQVQATPEVIGNGAVYLKPGETAPAVLGRVLSTAFQMEEGQPQLAEVEPGKTFLIFDVSGITPAAAAPLADVREMVEKAWRRAEGDKLAKAAADRVMKAVAKGETVAAAMAKEKVKLPAPDPVNMNREDLARLGGRVPPVLALLFSMAEGTVKRLEAPNDNGWFVVKLDDIEPGKLLPNDPLLAQVNGQLGQALGDEYAQQFTVAARKELGVERNKAAIDAVKKQLAGRN
ncbi:SurA N-terminal domain-containing protein [Altererythrobacter sp. CC-YST694]|uniref:peptidylprolyl isomerase n=1 Tax=Altererythrobacter sp. CC-YST694 TaxID=2755038 RepID=UPI001D005F3E|nr:SurA N-terminal domain-containing protein [Altererythrobacter sp. CC-YST694]MCB5424559.1 SurA N-terminal domain-containing protein [Altererythrobacter sp. CC-YST694]